MQRMFKKSLLILLAFVMVFTAMPIAFAEGEASGRPDHVIINKFYGGKDDGHVSHGFVELYNPTDEEIELDNYSLHYRTSADKEENHSSWTKLDLAGTIPANGYYLVRGAAMTDTEKVKIDVPEGDMEWDIQFHNKGVTFILMDNQDELDANVEGDLSGDNAPEGMVDLAAASGNDYKSGRDKGSNQLAPAYEGEDFVDKDGLQSKKRGVTRVNFSDTDDTSVDFVEVNYSKELTENLFPHSSTAIGTPHKEEPIVEPVVEDIQPVAGFMNGETTLDVDLIGRYSDDNASTDGGVMEIVSYNEKNGFAYAVNGVDGVLTAIDISQVGTAEEPRIMEGTEIDVKALVNDDTFAYGDMSSVAISPDGNYVAVAIQDENYDQSGRVAVFACDMNGSLTFERSITVGIQPDMVTYTPDGSKILTADEGEPRLGYVDSTDPKGSVTIIDTADFSKVIVYFDAFDSEEQIEALLADNVLISKKTEGGPVNPPSEDFEPEYIVATNSTAYVALQEANAIAVLDLNSEMFTGVYSIGFQDHSQVPVDLIRNDKYSPATYDTVVGARMPDGIALYTVGGTDYILTANEGDSREWGSGDNEYSNEDDRKNDPVPEKMRYLDTNLTAGAPEGKDVIFGGRSFTILKVTDSGLEEVYDSKDDFELYTDKYLPKYFNVSNDGLDMDKRSSRKGPEPETVIIGEVDGKTYAFIALERIGGIMIYDVTNPEEAEIVNYINSRDFSTVVGVDNSPEGLAFVPEENILLAAFEVSGNVSAYQLNSLVEDDEEDTNDDEESPRDEGGNPYARKKVDDYAIPVLSERRVEDKKPEEETEKSFEHSYVDVNTDDWFHDAVAFVTENGLMNGTGDDMFSPNAETTRGMVVTILYRLENEPSISQDSIYGDVENHMYYNDAIAWASTEGIVQGYDDFNFGPDDVVTREQIATMLYRFAEYKGYDVLARTDVSPFIDSQQINEYAEEAMAWAVAEGLVEGHEDGRLDPQGLATRAQIATILQRFVTNIVS